MSIDHVRLAEEYIIMLTRIKSERSSKYKLVKNIPLDKLDVVDRERWAVIKFCDFLLGNTITERLSD